MPAAPLLTLLAASSATARDVRARPFDVRHYRVELRLQADGAVEGRAELQLTPRASLATIELDAFGLDVTRVRSPQGPQATFTLAEDLAARMGVLRIRPTRPLPAGRAITLQVEYRARPGTRQARPELAALVSDVVVTPGNWGDDVRVRMTRLLEEVHSPAARAALERIASSGAGSPPAALARRVLGRNFPSPVPRPRTAGAQD